LGVSDQHEQLPSCQDGGLMPAFSRSRLAWLILTLALGWSAVASAGEEVAIEVTVENRSDQPLRCMLVFAHWTTLDFPVIAPGARISVDLNRAADRALFVRRAQDGRPMMLEALHCGHDARWSESLTKIDWSKPMLSEAHSFRLACAGRERLACEWREGP
jgi:hypothetical protein